MPIVQRVSVPPAVRMGLLLGGLFGWLLAFPMFGPLLFERAGEAAPALGLVFVFAHGAGLLTLHRLPLAGAIRHWLVRGAGLLVTGLTLAFWFGPAAAPLSFLLMTLIGLAAAILVLAWVDGWMTCGHRLSALTVGMVGANLIVALINMPRVLPVNYWLPLIAALALACSFQVAALATEERQAQATSGSKFPLPRTLIAVAAFALADYLVGGIWYSILSASVQSVSPWQPTLEALCYSLAVGLLYWRVRRGQRGELALYSLTALGLGLVVAAAGATGVATVYAFRAILLIGLAAGDLFFWDQLGQLGSTYGGRRSLGVGLGVSLLLIGLANWGAGLTTPGPEGPGRPFLLAGAALLFLVIPVIFRYTASSEAAVTTIPTPAGAGPNHKELVLPDGPAGLTPAERQVYALLVSGATDQEIAAQLVISPYTVKFHVRNLLRKAGVANRKELLSHLIATVVAASQEGKR